MAEQSYILPHTFEKYLGKQYAKSFKCFHANVRSIKSKECDLNIFFEQVQLSFDAVMLTETWCTNDADVFRLPSYKTIYSNRSTGRGGGICMLVSDAFTYELFEDFTVTNQDYEFLLIRIQNTALAVCYRPPNGSVIAFLEYLESVLTFITENHLDFICGGDVNINMMRSDSIKAKVDILLKAYGCYNVINLPTRVTETSSSLIDVFLTNVCSDDVKAGVFAFDLSDHLPVFMCSKGYIRRKYTPEVRVTQPITCHSLAGFRDRVISTCWDTIYSAADANCAYDEFIRLLKLVYAASFPFVRTKRSRKIRKPWISAELNARIKKKNNLYSQFIRTKDADKLKEFKIYRNKLGSDVKKARRAYMHHLFDSAAGCADILWKRLNSVLKQNAGTGKFEKMVINGSEVSGKPLADAFNEYLVNAVEKSPVFNDLKNFYYCGSSIFLDPVNDEEVIKLIRSLNNSTSKDIDGFQVAPIKHVVDILAPCLTHIFNLCLGQAVFPSKMQIARITVLFKKGDKNDMGNYRPISILPVLSKALEKVILKRLLQFEQKHRLLVDCQFGFRKGLSTEFALLAQKEFILSQLEDSRLVLGLFIDFTKAFDSINHNLLIRKLEHYGIRGQAATLIKSYLANRIQTVGVNGHLSDPLQVSCGVPQGSILGPFLFNLYINDIVTSAPAAKFIIYADDTSVFLSGHLADELIDEANSTLSALNEWSQMNMLKINTTKTKCVLFRPKNKRLSISKTISLQSTPVDIVPNFKSLGVTFNETLSWNKHIDFLTSKLAQVVGLVYRNHYILPRSIMLLIYNSLFSSRLSYCSLVWAPTTKENMQKIHLLQKQFLRIIENVPRYFHTFGFFKKYNVMPITAIYEYRLCKLLKQEFTNKSTFLQSLAQLRTNVITYPTRKNEQWKVSTYRTTYGLQKLQNMLPRTINNLGANNIQLESMTYKELRKHFMSL